jgi:hypothetical protein
MTDLIGGIRLLIQELIAPYMQSIHVRQDGLGKQIILQFDSMQRLMELKHNALMTRLDSICAEMRAEFVALRAANQFEIYRQLAPLSERVAVLEKRG